MRLFAQSTQHELSLDGQNPPIPEGQVQIRVSTDDKASILFNDESVDTIWSESGRSAYIHLDLTNRVGFHRLHLQVGRQEFAYDFETTSAKATWREVCEMADHLAQHIFAYRHQFQYSPPAGGIRQVYVPQVEHGWLRDRIAQVSSLVHAIAKRPATTAHQQVRTSLVGRRVDVAQTLRHLRGNVSLLERADDGLIAVGGSRYHPAAVRVREREREPARLEHEQIAAFLRNLALACEQLQHEVPPEHAAEVQAWSSTISRCRATRVVRKYDSPWLGAVWNPIPTMIQRTDQRYGRLRAIQAEYRRDIARQQSPDDAARTNVKDAWEIYQAFSAHVVGSALGLRYVSSNGNLRDRDAAGRSMISSDIGLYYDAKPPSDYLPSWRDDTSRPTFERPDITLIDYSNRRAIVLDAKFKTAQGHVRCASADLQEMQGYMQNYSLASGGIIFPGTGETSHLSARGYTLVELPLRPQSEAHDELLGRVREVLDTLWSPLAS